jgi:hypothetical protein
VTENKPISDVINQVLLKTDQSVTPLDHQIKIESFKTIIGVIRSSFIVSDQSVTSLDQVLLFQTN